MLIKAILWVVLSYLVIVALCYVVSWIRSFIASFRTDYGDQEDRRRRELGY